MRPGWTKPPVISMASAEALNCFRWGPQTVKRSHFPRLDTAQRNSGVAAISGNRAAECLTYGSGFSATPEPRREGGVHIVKREDLSCRSQQLRFCSAVAALDECDFLKRTPSGVCSTIRWVPGCQSSVSRTSCGSRICPSSDTIAVDRSGSPTAPTPSETLRIFRQRGLDDKRLSPAPQSSAGDVEQHFRWRQHRSEPSGTCPADRGDQRP